MPVWLDEVVRATLAVDPELRPPTMDALLVALDFRALDRAAAESRARVSRRRRVLGTSRSPNSAA